LDRVEELTATAIRAVRLTATAEEYFEYHFPGRPVVPGALLLAWLEHAGGVFVAHHTGGRAAVVLSEVQRVAFVRPGLPGDRLVVCVAFAEDASPVVVPAGPWPADGVVRTDEGVIARARLTFERVPYGQMTPPWSAVAAAIGLGAGAPAGGQ
jgi:3-hydroxymyristoyl/3-hydroxydecanoyl-(acyl carrier protein) dehydratase